MEDLDAEDLAKERSIFGNTKSEETESRGALDDEYSDGYQDDEDISMKKQGSGTFYDRNLAKRGSSEPQAPAYTVKRKPNDLYTKKGDESSNKEKQSKRKDAGDNSPDPNDSGDNGEDDSSME